LSEVRFSLGAGADKSVSQPEQSQQVGALKACNCQIRKPNMTVKVRQASVTHRRLSSHTPGFHYCVDCCLAAKLCACLGGFPESYYE
jgi:hypothetical protein